MDVVKDFHEKKELAMHLSHGVYKDWNGHVQIRGNIEEDGVVIAAKVYRKPAKFWSVYLENSLGYHDFIEDFENWHDAVIFAQSILKNYEPRVEHKDLRTDFNIHELIR